MPDHVAVEVHGRQTPAAKRRVDTFAVGRGGGRGRGVLAVMALDPAVGRIRFPQQRPVGSAEAEHREPAPVVARGGQEDPVAPDDG